jgi:hypothetical protein
MTDLVLLLSEASHDQLVIATSLPKFPTSRPAFGNTNHKALITPHVCLVFNWNYPEQASANGPARSKTIIDTTNPNAGSLGR